MRWNRCPYCLQTRCGRGHSAGILGVSLIASPNNRHQPNEQACDNHEYHNGCDTAADVNNLGVSFVLWRTHAFTLLGTRRVML